MALPADGQNANGLTKVTQIPAGKELLFIDPTTNEGGIITLEDLTKQILNGLASQAFALDAGQMTLPAALNYLYGNRLIGKSKVLSKNEVWNFSISYNCILMFCPSNDILSTVILSSNRYYNIGTGSLNTVSISVKNSTVKLTSLVDWPVRYNIIGI